MSKKFMFNSSMPRSGSELLQVILHQNPEIYGSPTSPLLGFCEGIKNHMEMPEVKSQPTELMRQAMLHSCRSAMDGFYEPITDRLNVCDKSRGWMIVHEWLTNIMGETPKMICMVRDLREVMVSQELVWRENQHLPIGGHLMVEQRVQEWLNNSHIATALQRLNDADIRGNLDSIHCVRFEDLTTDPKGTMSGIYDYLGMTQFTHDFKNVVKEVEENHEIHGVFGNHEIKPVVKPSPIRYNDILGRQVSEQIVANNPWFYNKFYQ
jgi:sulfotransferase